MMLPPLTILTVLAILTLWRAGFRLLYAVYLPCALESSYLGQLPRKTLPKNMNNFFTDEPYNSMQTLGFGKELKWNTDVAPQQEWNEKHTPFNQQWQEK